MKTILISGSSRGIGHALAKLCLADDMTVVGLSRQPDVFSEQANYQPFSIDFSDMAQLESRLKTIKSNIALPDVLVCNAGMGCIANIEQLSLAQMQTVMNVNFLSQAALIKTFLPDMKRRGSGKIIVLCSESALQGGKHGSLYCASKFALRGFCQSLRLECQSDNIAVSMVHPGLVRTEFFDDLPIQPGDAINDALSAEDVAQTIHAMLKLPAHAVVEELQLKAMQQKVQRR